MLKNVYSNGPVRNIVHLWSIDISISAEDMFDEALSLGSVSLLHLVQGMGDFERRDRIFLYTTTMSSQWVHRTGTVLGLFQSPMWGMSKVIGLEYPNLNCIMVDLDEQNVRISGKNLYKEMTYGEEEQQVVYRHGIRYVGRLAYKRDKKEQLAIPDSTGYELSVTEMGTIEGLKIGQLEKSPPGEGEVQVKVKCTGLNFRDVLLLLGSHVGTSLTNVIGGEFSGEIAALDPGVKNLCIGDSVIGAAPGSFKKLHDAGSCCFSKNALNSKLCCRCLNSE